MQISIPSSSTGSDSPPSTLMASTTRSAPYFDAISLRSFSLRQVTPVDVSLKTTQSAFTLPASRIAMSTCSSDGAVPSGDWGAITVAPVYDADSPSLDENSPKDGTTATSPGLRTEPTAASTPAVPEPDRTTISFFVLKTSCDLLCTLRYRS